MSNSKSIVFIWKSSKYMQTYNLQPYSQIFHFQFNQTYRYLIFGLRLFYQSTQGNYGSNYIHDWMKLKYNWGLSSLFIHGRGEGVRGREFWFNTTLIGKEKIVKKVNKKFWDSIFGRCPHEYPFYEWNLSTHRCILPKKDRLVFRLIWNGST